MPSTLNDEINADLIVLFHQGKQRFIRQFEAVFGVTPHQFRMRTQVEEAKGQQLGTSDEGE